MEAAPRLAPSAVKELAELPNGSCTIQPRAAWQGTCGPSPPRAPRRGCSSQSASGCSSPTASARCSPCSSGMAPYIRAPSSTPSTSCAAPSRAAELSPVFTEGWSWAITLLLYNMFQELPVA